MQSLSIPYIHVTFPIAFSPSKVFSRAAFHPFMTIFNIDIISWGHLPDRTVGEHPAALDILSVVLANFMFSQLGDCFVLSRGLFQILHFSASVFDRSALLDFFILCQAKSMFLRFWGLSARKNYWVIHWFAIFISFCKFTISEFIPLFDEMYLEFLSLFHASKILEKNPYTFEFDRQIKIKKKKKSGSGFAFFTPSIKLKPRR